MRWGYIVTRSCLTRILYLWHIPASSPVSLSEENQGGCNVLPKKNLPHNQYAVQLSKTSLSNLAFQLAKAFLHRCCQLIRVELGNELVRAHLFYQGIVEYPAKGGVQDDIEIL